MLKTGQSLDAIACARLTLMISGEEHAGAGSRWTRVSRTGMLDLKVSERSMRMQSIEIRWSVRKEYIPQFHGVPAPSMLYSLWGPASPSTDTLCCAMELLLSTGVFHSIYSSLSLLPHPRAPAINMTCAPIFESLPILPKTGAFAARYAPVQ